MITARKMEAIEAFPMQGKERRRERIGNHLWRVVWEDWDHQWRRLEGKKNQFERIRRELELKSRKASVVTIRMEKKIESLEIAMNPVQKKIEGERERSALITSSMASIIETLRRIVGHLD